MHPEPSGLPTRKLEGFIIYRYSGSIVNPVGILFIR